MWKEEKNHGNNDFFKKKPCLLEITDTIHKYRKVNQNIITQRKNKTNNSHHSNDNTHHYYALNCISMFEFAE